MNKIPKRYSQAMHLFLVYGSFLLLLLAIFFTFTYSYYRANTLKSAKNDLRNMCSSVQDSVEAQLDSLSTISMNIVYSNAIKENFKEFSKTYQQTGTEPRNMVASHEKALAIHDIVTAIIGAYQSASDIKLYTMDGSCVESGYWLSTNRVNIEAESWYDEVIDLNGYKYFTAPRTNKALPATGINHSSQKFISLIRLFLDSSDRPEGIVEVIQDCNKIFGLATQLEQNNEGVEVCIYDSYGRTMYPYNLLGGSRNPGILAAAGRAEDGASRMITDSSGGKFLLARQTILKYGWTVLITRTEESLYRPLDTFRKVFFLIAGISILFTLAICFLLARQITIPLRKLTAATGRITISHVLDENKVNLTSADSRIKELSILCEAIRSMYEKLRATSQEVLLSHNEETRAKLQATQSLINPHFLYNSLTSISIMAEEEMNGDIIRMCRALCDYFRYISSTKEMIVSLEEETRYTRRYLECMQLRFTDELEYTIDIPREAEDICIPKLITQPIVENAFKYAFTDRPPWKLSISALVEGAHWLIKIADNGGHLSDERKNELLSLYENLDYKEELKSMQIGGMGLKNVYLRLRLMYGSDAIFRIDNQSPGKTVFILGGSIFRSKEDYYETHGKI